MPEWVDDIPPEGDPGVLSTQPRQSNASDYPLLVWLVQDQDNFLSELICLEGRGRISDVCGGCGTLDPRFRCEDCFGVVMYCQDCVVGKHRQHPLHHLEYWTGSYFERRSLRDLGLQIQLGHWAGDRCYRPRPAARDDFTIIHSNGVHSIKLDFCGCESAEAPFQQLLCIRWFPASSEKPRTAATFNVLEQFHLLSFESKVSAFEFYQSLSRISDNTGLNPPKDRYEQFLRIIRQWRHLKLLKRTGRGHDPLGISNTKQGDCALLCPACPHPGKNLPQDWRSVGPEKQFLYSLFVTLDANFRLKRRAVSKDSNDPSLSEGWAYFVEESAYKSYLSHHVNDVQEKSTCSSHNAVNMADTKASRGLDATGVGIVVCARHGMKLANGIGDPQKGERYVNMDYLFTSALSGTTVDRLNISYDIACQWHRSLYQRMMSLPQAVRLDLSAKHVSFFVPKFHLPAHIMPCQWKYSFNWTRGVGRTDGEAPERGWAHINPVGSSTKVMGPGHRHDTIDDFFGDWNWKKTITLGSTIHRKISEAILQRNEHQEDFEELEKSLFIKYPEQLSTWRRQIEDWEDDPSKPNPFEVKEISITQASIRLQLAKEEARAAQRSPEPPLHPDISPSILISAGIDLEDQQRRLRVDLTKLGLHATDAQKAKMQQRSNALARHIEVWTKTHALYVPGSATLRDLYYSKGGGKASAPEDIPLYLPSQVNRKFSCAHNLESIEFQLREGQANDALNELRQALQSRAYMLKFKDRFLRGQGANTRACNCLKNVNGKIDLSVAKYRAAHRVLCMLGPLLGKVGWKTALRPLADDDVCSMSGEDDQATEDADDESDCGLQEAIQIEWCKARARAHRWAEEVDLLLEEKRRTLQFLEWDATRWAERAEAITDRDKPLNEGLRAYAERQANIRRRLGVSFMHTWRDAQEFSDVTYSEVPVN
ncbi:hypothetical protein EDD16DRAFT_1719774 [Pisolithus croceorrhizus]|nr:hypothetical protein EDD16DRAFT_1719774 [Pisolithus croceorrhizus]KAI6166420.1 hypothetical protein EDD17DRAFT_1753281 [Pisolithus thermaeus]